MEGINKDEKNKYFKIINYYKSLFKEGKQKEKDILQYLLELLELLNKNEIKEKEFMYILSAYSHFISDSDYSKYFYKYKKRNAKTKIFELLDLLMCDLFNDDIYYKRTQFVIKFTEINYIANLSKILLKAKITWEKTEIYTYNLYCELVSSLNSKINYWKKRKSEKLENLPLYKSYVNLLKTETDKEKIESLNSKMENLKLIEGNFFNKYIINLQYFLNGIIQNLNAKFKYTDLDLNENKVLFEDFLQLLSNYEFEIKDTRLINLWNDTLTPMTNDDKERYIKATNNYNAEFHQKRSFELVGNTLKKKVEGEKDFIIEEINDYNFLGLLEDLNKDINEENYDYYLNKNLKIDKYQSKLFIMKNKQFWIQLNISILGSKSFEESMKIVYGKNCKHLNYLKDQVYLSKEIFENIRFFIYKTKIGGNLNKNSLRIYEYGLFSNNNNKSLSLLLFYSFNTITNIQEICGHYYINYYNLVKEENENIMNSPNIEGNEDYYLYSDTAKQRKCELGESIEIAIFGRRIRELTIKEALFILEPQNYINGRKKLIEKFNTCNFKNVNDIISPMTINLLSFLEIVFDDLPLDTNEVFKYDQYLNNIDDLNNSVNYDVLHPPEFYCENLTDDELKEIITYFGLIQEDQKLLK